MQLTWNVYAHSVAIYIHKVTLISIHQGSKINQKLFARHWFGIISTSSCLVSWFSTNKPVLMASLLTKHFHLSKILLPMPSSVVQSPIFICGAISIGQMAPAGVTNWTPLYVSHYLSIAIIQIRALGSDNANPKSFQTLLLWTTQLSVLRSFFTN